MENLTKTLENMHLKIEKKEKTRNISEKKRRNTKARKKDKQLLLLFGVGKK